MIYYDFSAFQSASKPEEQVGRCRKVIVFLGNSLEFSNHNLDVIAAELPGIDILRLEKLAEVRELSEDRYLAKTILLVLAEDRLEDLTTRYARYAEASPDARIVFAYENEARAANVYETEIGQRVSYLPMRCRIDVWTAYIRLLCSGELIVPCALASRAGPRKPDHVKLVEESPSVHLTPRESEVLALVAEGAGNRQIAAEIGISEHTVKLHLHNVFAKLEVSNRAGAVAWFVRNVA